MVFTDMNKKRIWITWEKHRRSFELAKALNAEIYVWPKFEEFNRIIRYFCLSAKTLSVIAKERPDIIFVQNPSIILTALVAIFRNIFSYKLLTDRHSNFKFETLGNKSMKWKFFHFLSRYTVRNADMTIVTNDYLRDIVDKWGGRGFVLQDKLPELKLGKSIPLDGEKNIVFISTFSDDEPIAEIIDAAKRLNKNWRLYITGKYHGYRKKHLLRNLPANIRLTGFLSEEDYQSLLMSSDVLIILTTKDHLLNCGAYEAVVLLKPAVLSDTETIKNYFDKGMVFSKCDSHSIASAITEAVENNEKLKQDIGVLKEELVKNWGQRFENLIRTIREF